MNFDATGNGEAWVPKSSEEWLVRVTEKALAWLETATMEDVNRVIDGAIEGAVRAAKKKPSVEELRASFASKLDNGAPVTREEVAAWHGISVRQVDRWAKKAVGLLRKLPGYGRRTMFDSRVASRLRPSKKES